MLSPITPFIGRHDSVSWVTAYTGLHALSGFVIGRVSENLNLSIDAAIGSAVGIGVGWEIVEYWMEPVLGYWAVRNTGNTAIDIVAVLVLFMVTSKVAPLWQVENDNSTFILVLWVTLCAGIIAGQSAQMLRYMPETNPVKPSVQKRILLTIKALRSAVGKQWRRALHCLRRALNWAHAIFVCSEQPNKPDPGHDERVKKTDPELVWLHDKDGINKRAVLSPPHRMLAALCAIVIAVCAQFNWHALPTYLISALVGFALTFPSNNIVIQENKMTNEVPLKWEGEQKELCGCPFYRVWPQNSEHKARHDGRDNARRKFRMICLPVRYLLMLLLLLVAPRVTVPRFAFIVLGAMSFCYVAFGLCQEMCAGVEKVWWSREYLLIEIGVIIVFFALLDHAMACYASFALLAVHWTVSVWLSGFWPKVDTIAAVRKPAETVLLTTGTTQPSSASMFIGPLRF